MARLPSRLELSGPVSLVSKRVIASQDESAIGRGMQSLASDLGAIAQEARQQQNTVDIARAEAYKTEGLLAAQNEFQNDPDYTTYNKRAPVRTGDVVTKAADLIRDPEMRERWRLGAQSDAARVNDGIYDQGVTTRRQAETVAFDDALETNRRIYVDPDTTEEAKAKAKQDIEGSIQQGLATGLLTPDAADARRKSYLEDAEFSRGQLAVERDPSVVLNSPARDPSSIIGAMQKVESTNNPDAVSGKGATGLMQVMPSTAPEIARELGDENFPASGTEAEIQAYLKDSDVSVAYGTHYFNKMLDRYGGDVEAALVAYNGGPDRGDEWVAAGKDDSVIPRETADYYKKVLANTGTIAARGKDLPIIIGDVKGLGRLTNPDINGVSPVVIDRFKQVQNAFGKSVPIVSGYRDASRNAKAGGAKHSQHIEGNALDLDVSKMSQGERLELIQAASAAGFTGIGVYGNSIHLDIGARRAWGPSHGSESVPAWAKGTIDAHLAGKTAPLGVRRQPGWLMAMSPEQRAAVTKQAEAYQRERDNALAAQLKADQAAARDGFALRIATADPTLTTADILNSQVIHDGDKAALVNSFNKKMDETINTAAAMQAFGQGALQVDPFDEKGRKTVDNVYDGLTKALPEDQLFGAGEELVRQSGVVPKAVMSQIRGGLQSQNVSEVAAAAQAAQRISTINPAALGRRDGGGEVQNMADDFTHFVNDLNMSPEDAARRMIEARDPAKKLARKAMEPAAKEFVKEMQSVDLASEFNDSWFGGDPALGLNAGQALGIQAEFVAIAEDQFYATNGDPELAKSRAVEQMKRLYGASEFNSGAVVKHPPERYWPHQRNTGGPLGIGADPLQYAKTQLFGEISTLDPEHEPGSVQLVTTPETDAMVKRGEMPAYSVLWKDKNGVLQTFPDKLWRPDPSKMEELDRANEEAEAAKTMDRARDMQADELDRARILAAPDSGRGAALDAFIEGPNAQPEPEAPEVKAKPVQVPQFDEPPSGDTLEPTPGSAM